MREGRGRGTTKKETCGRKKKGGVRTEVKKAAGLSEFLNRYFEQGAAEWRMIKALGESEQFGGISDAKQQARIRKHAWRLKDAGKDVRFDEKKKFYKIVD